MLEKVTFWSFLIKKINLDLKLDEEDEDYELMRKSMDCVNTYGPK